MVTFIQKIIHAPFVGAKWVGALESVANGDFASATHHLQYLARFFENKNVEYHLLKGFVEYASNDDSSAVEDISLSIILLRKSAKYTEPEKKYLECYAAIYGNLANENLPLKPQVDMFEKVPWEDVDLSVVRKELKKTFLCVSIPGGMSKRRSYGFPQA